MPQYVAWFNGLLGKILIVDRQIQERNLEYGGNK